MPTPDKEGLRRELLEAVYDFVEASHRPRQVAHLERDKWADEQGYEQDAVRRADDWLRDRGFVDHPSMGDLVAITPAGQDEVERMRREPGPQPATPFLTIVELRRLEAVAGAVQRLLDEHEDEIDPEDVQDLRAQLDTIEAQKRSPRPRRDVMAAAIGAITWMADKAAGGAVGRAAWEGVKAAAQAVF